MTAVTPLESRRTAGFSSTPDTSDLIMQMHDLAIGYSGREPRVIAAGIEVGLKAGELVCLIGPNGVGKSTLMRTLAGIQPPLRGRVSLMGDDVHRLAARELARRLSVVLTERVNPGLLTARTLVALGRHPYTDWSGRLTAQDETAVRESLAAVGATALADRQVGELSDGERQKIMIARALAQEPAVMILDEPTAFLDLPRRVEIMQLLRKLAHEHGRTILLSTHDLDLALRTADRIWQMAGGSLEAGAPEDLVLSGAFEAAFHAEGVTFDAQTGAFRINETGQKQISVMGKGLAAVWTRRALERAGFAVVEGAALQVEVEGSRWQVIEGAETQAYGSVGELVEGLASLSEGRI